MNVFEKIAAGLNTGAPPMGPVSALSGARPPETRFQKVRGSIGMPAAIVGQSYVDNIAKRNFVQDATAAAGGDLGRANLYADDIVGASLMDPDGASKMRSASNKYTGTVAAGSSLIPVLAGGLKGGGPYGLFFGAGPLAQQGINNWQTSSTVDALRALPKDQQMPAWMRFNDPGERASFKAENPAVFDRLSNIQSNAQTANEIRGGVFDQWNGPKIGPVPLHAPSAQTAGAAAVLRGAGSVLSRVGADTASNALKGLATASAAKGWNSLVPTPALLLRGAGAGAATWGTNKVNSLIGGPGAPAVADATTGRTQYDEDHPWWHDSLRGIRSSAAGAVGGTPLGPVGAIGGAIVNPVREAWDDISEVGKSLKERYVDESMDSRNARVLEDSRRAWQVREANAKFDAGAAKSQADSQALMKSFSDYRTALGIGVGVPLAGLLLYRMFSSKKKKPEAPAPQD